MFDLACNLVTKSPNFLFVIPVWILALLAFRGVFDDGEPTWDYLWDDRKNYVNNPRVQSLSISNVHWAFTDGVVLGVFEPVSLIIKQVLHTFIQFDPRIYRVVTFSVHMINVYLVFRVGRNFLASVSDYTYYQQKLASLVAEKERRLAKLDEMTTKNKRDTQKDVPGSASLRKTKKKKKDRDDFGATGAESLQQEIREFLMNAQAEFSYLRMHEAFGIIGCMLGTGVFAVHPFQAQIIGWISCLPYCLSCFFCLLSFNEYVAHRTCLRDWRRSMRLNSSRDIFEQPWRISFGKTGKRDIIKPEEAETWLLTTHKAASLVFYVMATFCKAPAVILPAVFVIIDVFVYSSPLSVHEEGALILHEAVGIVEAAAQSHGNKFSWLLPNRLLSRFFGCDFPALWHLTINAVGASALFFASALLSMAFLVSGNSSTILDPLSMFEKFEKATLALTWYAWKFFMPTQLVAAVEMQSFSCFDHWEVAVSLAMVPYGTLAILAHSMSNTPRRLLACAWGVFVALLLPSLGFIQHGRMFLAADRYMYIPLAMTGPLVGTLASAWFTVAVVSGKPLAGKFVHAGGPIARLSTSKFRKSLSYSATGYLDASIIFDQLESNSDKLKIRAQREDTDTNRYTARTKVVVSIAVITSCVTIMGGVVFFAASLTPYTLHFWRNTELLWERNLEIIPDSENAHVNLSGHYASSSSSLDKALLHAKAAEALRPKHAKYLYNIAELYRLKLENDEAKDRFISLLQGSPPRWLLPEIHYSLGMTLRELGELDISQRELELAASMGKTKAKSELNKLNERRLHDKKTTSK